MEQTSGTAMTGSPAKHCQFRFVIDGFEFDFAEGDLIFGNRLSWMQRVMNVSGDFLSHVGIVVELNGELVVVELGPNGLFTRTISEFIAAYRFVGQARPAHCGGCRTRFVDTAIGYLRAGRLRYSMGACSLLEACMLVRRFAPRRAERTINEHARQAAAKYARHIGDDTVTCSGFVHLCLQAADGDCRTDVHWPTRERVSPWRSAPSVTDVRGVIVESGPQDAAAVRALVMPYDLWVAVPCEFRAVVADGSATVIYDRTLNASKPLPSQRGTDQRSLDVAS